MIKRIIKILLFTFITYNISNTNAQGIHFNNLKYECKYLYDSTIKKVIVDTITFTFNFSYDSLCAVEEELNYFDFEYGYVDTNNFILFSSFADIQVTNDDKLKVFDPYKSWFWSYNKVGDFIMKKCIRQFQIPTIHFAIIQIGIFYNDGDHYYKEIDFGQISNELDIPFQQLKGFDIYY